MIYLLSNKREDFIFNTEDALKEYIYKKELCVDCIMYDSLSKDSSLKELLTSVCGSKLIVREVSI